MTREILFRGYCPDEKRWVYGYYVKYEGNPEDGVSGCEAIGEPQKDMWFDWKEVDPLTLCQYSEFNDRYGNPLYHGDKVRSLDALINNEQVIDLGDYERDDGKLVPVGIFYGDSARSVVGNLRLAGVPCGWLK